MTDEQIVPMLTAWQEWHIKSGISIEDIPPMLGGMHGTRILTRIVKQK